MSTLGDRVVDIGPPLPERFVMSVEVPWGTVVPLTGQTWAVNTKDLLRDDVCLTDVLGRHRPQFFGAPVFNCTRREDRDELWNVDPDALIEMDFWL